MLALDQFLDPALITRCQRMRRYTATLWEALPAEFSGHCSVVGWNDEIISLSADSAAWATRLRFFERAVLDCLADDLPGRRRVRCRVAPIDYALIQRPTHHRQMVAPPDATALMDLAERETHAPLAAALRRLAARAERN